MEEKVLQRGGELDMVIKRDDAGRETVVERNGETENAEIKLLFRYVCGMFCVVGDGILSFNKVVIRYKLF